MNNQDTFNIICSYLNPKELVKFSFLSNIHNKWTNIHLTKNFKKLNIEEYVCPICANWVEDKEDISNYNEFSDYYMTDDMKRLRFSSVEEWFGDSSYYDYQIERSKILCDDCEYNEDYSENIFINFRYKGSREYTILYFYSTCSWVALCLKYKDKICWNEYRKPISLTYKEYIVSENSNDPYRYNYSNSYNNEDEYDDDNDIDDYGDDLY
jgi:hypothetical protein